MEKWMVAVVVVVLMLVKVLWSSKRKGNRRRRRRLLEITEVVTSAPSATVVMRVPLMRKQHILTADPENVEHILKTNFENYQKGSAFRGSLEDLFGECIVNADGQCWRKQRVFAAREFSVPFLHLYGDTILDSEISQRLLPLLDAKAKASSVFDLQDVLLRFAMDNICRAAFSYDPECLLISPPSSEFSETFDNAVLLISHRLKTMLPPKLLWMKKALNIGYERELKKSVKAVKRIIMGMLLDRKNNGEEDKEDDFLSRLPKLSRYLYSSEEEVEFMGNMVAGVILAGRDTTSAVLTWFFWLVANNPRVEESILEEIEMIKGIKGAYEAAREMPYTHAALCETMRLYPPIPVVIKEALNQDVLPADGTPVATGDRVVILTYAMGRLQRLWGTDLNDFRPERWLSRTNSDSSSSWRFVGTDPYRFPVFNAGPRICLGKEMAFVQMKRVVAAVLGSFRVVLATSTATATASPPPPPDFIFDLTAKMKGGFPVTLHDRPSNHSRAPTSIQNPII